MSKLLKRYEDLKNKDKDKVYIFKVGIFYNIINEDARLVSDAIGLKLTDLGPEIVKCGFPISKLDKYTQLLDQKKIDFHVVADLTPSNQKTSYESIIKEIQKVDLDNTTCKEAFDILYMIQQKINNIQ